jgi:pyridoxamine 5'-phosphate oxidase
MQKNEIIDFISANPLFFLATCDGEQARVRGIMMYRIDELGNIVFTTGKSKAMYQQLQKNNKIECCFYANNTQIRVQGELIESDNLALKQEIVEARPFMKPWVEATGYESIGIFILTKCKATVWTMETATMRKRYVNLFEV